MSVLIVSGVVAIADGHTMSIAELLKQIALGSEPTRVVHRIGRAVMYLTVATAGDGSESDTR